MTESAIDKKQKAAASGKKSQKKKTSLGSYCECDLPVMLRRPWGWKCECSDYEYRGQYKMPPRCEHILGVARTLAGDHVALHEAQYIPSFTNEDGPMGYALPIEMERNIVEQCRGWDVRSASHDGTYQVVRFTHRPWDE